MHACLTADMYRSSSFFIRSFSFFILENPHEHPFRSDITWKRLCQKKHTDFPLTLLIFSRILLSIPRQTDPERQELGMNEVEQGRKSEVLYTNLLADSIFKPRKPSESRLKPGQQPPDQTTVED